MKAKSIFLLFLLSCSGGNNRSNYYSIESIPTYETLQDRDFLSTKITDTTRFPLEASSSSYYNLKEAVDNSSLPTQTNTEELLNSFSYNYPKPKEEKALGIYLEAAISPWNSKRKLIHIGINSTPEEKEQKEKVQAKNLIFAVDTSGSMSGNDRIELAKNSIKSMIQGLSEKDSVAIIDYTDDAKVALPPTSLLARGKVLHSASSLNPSGGTNAWPGILLAYKVAKQMRKNNQQTKIIIVTDGDFGGVNNDEFLTLVDKENKSGITISILGFGMGLQNVDTMDKLSVSKKGEAFYIKSMTEANRYLSLTTWSTWKALAKDINLEVKFNPNQVESFRLIGYEKFSSNNTKTPLDVPASFSYTALYEIVPAPDSSTNAELLSVKLNYKTDTGKVEEVKESLQDSTISTWDASENFRFAAGIAGLGMILNNSQYKGSLDYYMVIHLVQSATSFDPDGQRLELLSIVNRLKNLSK